MERPSEQPVGARFRQTLSELAQLDKSDLEAALRLVAERVATVATIERVSYWELAPDHASIRCRVQYSASSGQFTSGAELRAPDFPLYFDALLACRVIVAHDAWRHPQTLEFTEAYFRPHGITAMLDVPVWRQGKLAGVLCHEHVGAPRTWTGAEQDFAVAVANIVSVALEETDRRRAEERHLLVGRASNDVLWDWDLTSDTIEFSEGVTTVFRYPPEQVAHTLAWWDGRIHSDDRERVLGSLAAAFAAGGTTWSEQYRWYRGDGTVATVLDRACITYDAGARPRRMVGAIIDLTDRLALEARVALSDRLASIGQLASGVAHEINNPLAYVLANLSSAIEDLEAGAGRDGIVGLLREAVEGAERVRRVVRDLQTFARPREDDLESIDVHALVESSINMAWNQLRHRARVVRDLRPVPPVRMNRARFGQVVLNLLVNAAQAIQEGAVDANQVAVTTAVTDDGQVAIEVRDTGCGFTAAVRDRLFEPFFTTKDVGVGTGLGLPICRSIVLAAGGTIELRSPPEGGCIARVTLPAAEPEEPAARPAVSPSAPRRRVLIVEDEARLRDALCRMLRAHHDVVAVDSGERALAHLRQSPQVDAVLCDLMMPNMTGMELHERLQAEAPEQAARMVFMTGGAFTPTARAFVANAAHKVLEKPVAKADLCRAIEEVSAAA